jgi:hypothetical protein
LFAYDDIGTGCTVVRNRSVLPLAGLLSSRAMDEEERQYGKRRRGGEEYEVRAAQLVSCVQRPL